MNRFLTGFVNTKQGKKITFDSTMNDGIGKKLENYRIYGNTIQGKLPNEYQEVEYIESTGTQYIDTNYYLQSNQFEIKTKIKIDDMPNYEQDIVSNQENLTDRFVLGLVNKKVFGYSRTTISDTNVLSKEYTGEATLEIDMKYDYANRKKTLLVNEEKTEETMNCTIANSNSKIRLFSGTSVVEWRNAFIGKCYRMQMYVDNNLILNFVPCYRKSDNEIGLYDLVNNVFYTNSGTGTFLKGKNVPTPEAPIEIESVGDLVISGEYQGKYKIPAKIEGKNNFPYIIDKTQYYSTSNNGIYVANKNYWETVDITFEENGFKINSYDTTGYRWISLPITLPKNTNLKIKLDTNSTHSTDIILVGFNEEITTGKTGTKIADIGLDGTEFNSGNYENYMISFYPQINDRYWHNINIQLASISDNTFEPYKEPIITNIYLDKPLNKIGNYTDYIDFKLFKKYKRIIYEKMTSDKNWQISTGWSKPNTNVFYYNLDDSTPIDSNIVNILSNYFKGYSRNELYDNDINGICISGSNAVPRAITVRIEKSIANNVAEFKEWLTQNDVEIIYIDSTTTEETIELPEIMTTHGTNILSLDTKVEPSNVQIDYRSIVKE